MPITGPISQLPQANVPAVSAAKLQVQNLPPKEVQQVPIKDVVNLPLKLKPGNPGLDNGSTSY